MLPDRVSNPGPLTYELGALPIALRGPATNTSEVIIGQSTHISIVFLHLLVCGIAMTIDAVYSWPLLPCIECNSIHGITLFLGANL